MKICYFGIYDPEFGRNKVYISGLRALGHEVVECRDSSPGLLKYFRLRRKHAAILKNGGYDAMIVGYPGHIVVPLAQKLSRKPVIFDALCTLYEGEVISRGRYRNNPFKRAWINYIDMSAVKAANVTLVETNAQRDFFIKRFDVEPAKVARVFTGTDEEVFYPDPQARKRPVFTVGFRGKFLPEAGVKYIVEAAKALEHQGVKFLIIGNGHAHDEVAATIQSLNPTNVEWVSETLPTLGDLAKLMRECHVSLGQFEKHERLGRTIPHKAFEALAMGLPYITARAEGVSELLTDGKDCLMVNPGDPEDLAAKILQLKNNPELAAILAKNGRELFETKLTSKKLAAEILQVI